MHKFSLGDRDHADHTKMRRSIAMNSTSECTNTLSKQGKGNVALDPDDKGKGGQKVISMGTMMDYGLIFRHSTFPLQ